MSQPTLADPIVWGNTPEQIYFDTNWPGEAITIEYSNVQGGQAGIVTNGQGRSIGARAICRGPPASSVLAWATIVWPIAAPYWAGKAAGAPSTDIEGDPRPNPAGSNPDMGAYQHPLGSPPRPTNVFAVREQHAPKRGG